MYVDCGLTLQSAPELFVPLVKMGSERNLVKYFNVWCIYLTKQHMSHLSHLLFIFPSTDRYTTGQKFRHIHSFFPNILE